MYLITMCMSSLITNCMTLMCHYTIASICDDSKYKQEHLDSLISGGL